MTTTTPQHTPGPWRVRHDGTSSGIYAPSINGYDIARVHGYAERPGGGTMLLGPEHQANAALIAAAPDLLAALVDLLRAADAVHSFGLPHIPPTTADWFRSAQAAAESAIARAQGGQ
jgi:hypothetical protein